MPPATDDLGPARLLERVGLALYGDEWKSAIADDLGVPRRAVQNWANGRNAIPPGVWRDLVGRVRPTLAALEDVLAAMAAELAKHETPETREC